MSASKPLDISSLSGKLRDVRKATTVKQENVGLAQLRQQIVDLTATVVQLDKTNASNVKLLKDANQKLKASQAKVATLEEIVRGHAKALNSKQVDEEKERARYEAIQEQQANAEKTNLDARRTLFFAARTIEAITGGESLVTPKDCGLSSDLDSVIEDISRHAGLTPVPPRPTLSIGKTPKKSSRQSKRTRANKVEDSSSDWFASSGGSSYESIGSSSYESTGSSSTFSIGTDKSVTSTDCSDSITTSTEYSPISTDRSWGGSTDRSSTSTDSSSTSTGYSSTSTGLSSSSTDRSSTGTEESPYESKSKKRKSEVNSTKGKGKAKAKPKTPPIREEEWNSEEEYPERSYYSPEPGDETFPLFVNFGKPKIYCQRHLRCDNTFKHRGRCGKKFSKTDVDKWIEESEY